MEKNIKARISLRVDYEFQTICFYKQGSITPATHKSNAAQIDTSLNMHPGL